jgi:gas vesicle protein
MKGLLKIAFGATVGAAYGLMFAQKAGKNLRADLKRAKNPGKLLWGELKKISKESGGAVANFIKNSKELQEVMSSGKSQFEQLVKGAKELGSEASQIVKEELEDLAKNAKNAAEDLGKEVKSQGNKFKNELKKEVKTIAQKMTPKKTTKK